MQRDLQNHLKRSHESLRQVIILHILTPLPLGHLHEQKGPRSLPEQRAHRPGLRGHHPERRGHLLEQRVHHLAQVDLRIL